MRLKKTIFLLICLIFCQKSPADETRKRIAVIDTGISSDFPSEFLCYEGHKDFTSEGLQDLKQHGTLVGYILAHYINPNKFCIVVLKYWQNGSSENPWNYLKALKYVSEGKYYALNLSLAGDGILPLEKTYLEKIMNNGVIISNAAGNDHINLTEHCSVWPACYKILNFVVAACRGNVLEWYSNYGGPVNACELGTQEYAGIRNRGTSFSSPVFLGKYIKEHE